MMNCFRGLPPISHARPCVKVSTSFDGEGVVDALNSMAEQGWWDDLEERAEGSEEEEYNEVVNWYDGNMPMHVREVKPDGWVFDRHPDDADGEVTPGIFLRLPPEVAAMGVAYMELSCMSLALRRGVWRPVSTYGDDDVVVNVYPP